MVASREALVQRRSPSKVVWRDLGADSPLW